MALTVLLIARFIIRISLLLRAGVRCAVRRTVSLLRLLAASMGPKLSDLPADVLDKIVAHLGTKQRARLASTCRALWAQGCRRHSWWHSVALHPAGDRECTELAHWLGQRRGLVSELFLDTSKCSEGPAATLVQALAGGAVAALTWVLGSPDEGILERDCSHQRPALQGLQPEGSCTHNSGLGFCMKLRHMSNLTCLNISSSVAPNFSTACLPPSLRQLEIRIVGDSGIDASGSLIPHLASAAAAVTALDSLSVVVSEPQLWEGLQVDLSSLRQPWAAHLTQLRLSLPAKNVDVGPLAALTDLQVLEIQLEDAVGAGQAADSTWQHPLDGLSQLRKLRLGGFACGLYLGCMLPLPLSRLRRLEVLNLAGSHLALNKSLDWLKDCRAYHLTLSLHSAHWLVRQLQLPAVTFFTMDATDFLSVSVRRKVALDTLEALLLLLPNLQKVEWVLPSEESVRPAARSRTRGMGRLLMERKPPQIELVVLVEAGPCMHVPDE